MYGVTQNAVFHQLLHFFPVFFASEFERKYIVNLKITYLQMPHIPFGHHVRHVTKHDAR